MSATLSLNLTNKLTINPQLKQSVEILGLGHEDLNSMLEQQSQSNPFLEVNKTNSKFQSATHNFKANKNNVNDDDKEEIFNLTVATIDYKEDLHQQLYLKKIDKRLLALVQYLIENLDEHGYLIESLEELLTFLPKNALIKLAELEQALQILQSLAPVGIGARNASECLCLQLHDKLCNLNLSKKQNINFQLAYKITASYLDIISKKQYNKLATILKVQVSQIKECEQIIYSLNPHPIIDDTQNDKMYHITPDFFVYQTKEGKWNIELNQELMPKININNSYAETINSLTADSIDYVKQKLKEAHWLIKSIQQRFDTLQKVATLILREQEAFFNHGNMAMQPLIMQTIADNLNIHVSTVCRAVKNKYLQCNSGIYPLSYFLSPSLKTKAGGYVSTKTISSYIKNLINQESSLNPLSDEKIAQSLQAQGINVARRTVTKYRTQLDLPVASVRKNK